MGKHKKSKHKSSKKSHKHKSEHENPREGNSLLEFAAEAVADHVTLLDLLPPVIASIDRGATETLDHIHDKSMRSAMDGILKRLQVLDYEGGWRRSAANIKVHKLLASEFLMADHNRLFSSTQQNLSPGVLLALVLFFPDVLAELPSLLQQLVDGNAVQIGGIENASLRQGLGALLVTLGCAEGAEGHSAQSSRRARALLKVLRRYAKQGGERRLTFPDKHSSSRKGEEEVEEEEDSSSDESVGQPLQQTQTEQQLPPDEDIEEESTLISAAAAAPRIGPQLPSAGEPLAYASGSEDEDEGLGPQLPTQTHSMAPQPAALGLVGVTLYKGAAEQKDPVKEGREEWLLTPGDSSAIKALGGGEHGLFNIPRKFNAGKQAKKKAEDMAIQREYLQKAAEKRALEKGIDIPVAAAPVEKASSLLEEHMAKRAKTEAKALPVGSRRPFDRETDVLSGRKMTAADLMRLAENAKELGDKFDKANVQRNFL